MQLVQSSSSIRGLTVVDLFQEAKSLENISHQFTTDEVTGTPDVEVAMFSVFGDDRSMPTAQLKCRLAISTTSSISHLHEPEDYMQSLM